LTGEQLTRWTVRLALLLYAATLTLRYFRPPRPRLGRGLWTAGCLLFVAHVAAAFHSFHHWSHDEAYRETARQTADLVGMSSGWGLYLNYLFTLVWIADTAWWWGRGVNAHHQRPRWISATLDAFMAFMAFNGAVVFGHGATRWVGAAVTLLLVVVAIGARAQKQ
jgi:hypothetical protein